MKTKDVRNLDSVFRLRNLHFFRKTKNGALGVCGIWNGHSVTGNLNGAAEFHNANQSLNQAPFKELRWAGWDLNPRSSPREGDVLAS